MRLHVDPAAQVVQPVQPAPPHWPHLATVQVAGDEGVGLGTTDVTSVVGAGLGLGLGLGLAPPPLHEKTAGPGTV